MTDLIINEKYWSITNILSISTDDMKKVLEIKMFKQVLLF